MTQGERITALEVRMDALQKSMEKHTEETEARHKVMNEKLDDLLGLRNKGVGAFWVASALAGTGIVSLVIAILDWIKGVPNA